MARATVARDTLQVAVSDGCGRPVGAGGLAGWLARVAPARARGDVAIALVSDARMRELNRRHRRQDRPTDVLAFPLSAVRRSRSAAPVQGPVPDREQRAAGRELGDVAIATGVARRQAREAGHSYDAELRVLALHGLLHLLGYDHHDTNDRGRMARLEARLRRKGGLPSGLLERGSAGLQAGKRP